MAPVERGPLASALGVDKSASTGAASGASRVIAASSRQPLSQPWTQVVSGQHRTAAAAVGPSSPQSTVQTGGASNVPSTSTTAEFSRAPLQDHWQGHGRQQTYPPRGNQQPPPPQEPNHSHNRAPYAGTQRGGETWRRDNTRRSSNVSASSPPNDVQQFKNQDRTRARPEPVDNSARGSAGGAPSAAHEYQSSFFSKRWSDERDSEDEVAQQTVTQHAPGENRGGYTATQLPPRQPPYASRDASTWSSRTPASGAPAGRRNSNRQAEHGTRRPEEKPKQHPSGGVVYGYGLRQTSNSPPQQQFQREKQLQQQVFAISGNGASEGMLRGDQKLWGASGTAEDHRQIADSRHEQVRDNLGTWVTGSGQQDWQRFDVRRQVMTPHQHHVDGSRQQPQPVYSGGGNHDLVGREAFARLSYDSVAVRSNMGEMPPQATNNRNGSQTPSTEKSLSGYDTAEGVYDYQGPMGRPAPAAAAPSTQQNGLMVVMAPPPGNAFPQAHSNTGQFYSGGLPTGGYVFYSSPMMQGYDHYPVYDLPPGGAGLYLPDATSAATAHMSVQRGAVPVVWDCSQQQMMRPPHAPDFVEPEKAQQNLPDDFSRSHQSGSRNILRRAPQVPESKPAAAPPSRVLPGLSQSREPVAEGTVAEGRRSWNVKALARGVYDDHGIRYVDHLKATNTENAVRDSHRQHVNSHPPRQIEGIQTGRQFDNTRARGRTLSGTVAPPQGGFPRGRPPVDTFHNDGRQGFNSRPFSRGRGQVCRHFMSGKCSFEHCKFLHPEHLGGNRMERHGSVATRASTGRGQQRRSSPGKSRDEVQGFRREGGSRGRPSEGGAAWRQIDRHLQQETPAASRVTLSPEFPGRSRDQAAQQQSPPPVKPAASAPPALEDEVAAAVAGESVAVAEDKKRKQRKRRRGKEASNASRRPSSQQNAPKDGGVWQKNQETGTSPRDTRQPTLPSSPVETRDAPLRTAEEFSPEPQTEETPAPGRALPLSDLPAADRAAQARHFHSSLSRTFHGRGANASGSRVTTSSSAAHLPERQGGSGAASSVPLTTGGSSVQACTARDSETTASTQSRPTTIIISPASLHARPEPRRKPPRRSRGGGGSGPAAARGAPPAEDMPHTQEAAALPTQRPRNELRRKQPWRRRQGGAQGSQEVQNNTPATTAPTQQGRERNNSNRGWRPPPRTAPGVS